MFMSAPYRAWFFAFTFAAARADLVGPIDFETAGQLGANFRVLNTAGTRVLSQTANGVGNDLISLEDTSPTSTGAVVGIYDTTPADTTAATAFTVAAAQFRVTFNLTAGANSSSFGVHLLDPNNSSNNLLALFNVGTGAADTLRFWRDSSAIATGGAGTQIGATVTGDAGYDVGGSPALFELSVDNTGAAPVFNLTVGTLSATSAFVAGDLNFLPQVAFRLFDSSNAGATAATLDNFTVTVVPEPAALPLLAAGAGLLLLRRRR